MILQFSAQIDSAKANNDRTLSIKIDTQELMPEETAHIFSMFQKQIWCAFAETTITKEDLNIPEVVDEMDKKSPSQRLRDRMFVFWKESNPMTKEGFDSWYKSQLDKIGERYLEKIQ